MNIKKQVKYKTLRINICTVLIIIFCAIFANAHDLFLKLDEYYLTVNSTAVARFMNGTFQISERAIDHNRFRYISLVAPNNKLIQLDPVEWRDEKTTSTIALHPSEAGTYVLGASLTPKEITLKADRFNNYLEHSGLLDILAERKKNNELNKDAHEQYSKHVKAIFQTGEKYTDNFKAPLNYPVEIIPLQNPYLLKTGQPLEIQCLLNGNPIVNQFVFAGYEGTQEEISATTDVNGIARFILKKPGKCYIRMIHMTKLNDSVFDYESKWATLTFDIKH